MIEKVRPIAVIAHSNGNDGWDAHDYIMYRCPGCSKILQRKDIACDECGTFFDWSKMAEIKTVKQIVWV